MVFDYKGKMKGKDTLHMWNYTVDQGSTHGALSPLRPTISNPNIHDATDIIISFQVRETLSVMLKKAAIIFTNHVVERRV